MPKTILADETVLRGLVTELPTIQSLCDQAIALARGNAEFSNKASGMMDIAGRLSEAITPHTPCKKGCNHCCYMAVSVTSFEAALISKYLGRPMATKGLPALHYAMEDPSITKYTGVACSLLGGDGRCTVYPVRPLACRTHHNVAADEENCRIANAPDPANLATTPSLDLTDFQIAQSFVMLTHDERYADIRDFFPTAERVGDF